MKAIRVRYKGPTNYRGSRLIADDYDGHKVTISFDYALSGEELYKKAAQALLDKMDWKGDIIGGGTDTGYVFVFKR